MPYRILFCASMHHPEQLRAYAAAHPGEPPPLFPPSMSQHFWEKALRKRGHTLAAFYRNLPALAVGGAERGSTRTHRQGITPAKLVQAAWNRIPPEVNPDLRLRNQQLIEQARTFRPDVLWMVGDNTVILPDTLARIKRETRCKIVYACGTSPIVFSHRIDRAAARLYDLVIASDYYHGIQWQELGAPRMVSLPIAACDPDFHHPYPLTDDERAAFACDVAFVGTLVPNHLYSRRVRALKALSAAGFDLGIWSVHDLPASLRQHHRGKALGETMERILSAAKICFNTHGDFVFYGGNLRLFEVAGAGVFQVTDDLPGVQTWFPQVDGTPTLVTYADAADLCRKVEHYLAHETERAAIAANGQRHVYAHHTYDRRVQAFESLIGAL
ncbi:MAG: glycosyltransferase [bacterium]|nr:glycosyltransferase [bacterium]